MSISSYIEETPGFINTHTYTVKKVHEFPVSSRDVTNQTPPGQEKLSYDVIIPAQGEFGSDIPAGDGKLANLFFTVYLLPPPHTVTKANQNEALLWKIAVLGMKSPPIK